MRKIGLVSFLLWMVIAGGALTGCGKPAAVTVTRPEVAGVTVMTVQNESVEETFEAAGTVKARSVSSVASKVMGRVDSIEVTAGERVKAGQLLMTLENSDSRQKYQGAAAAYEEALRGRDIAQANRELQDVTYARYKKLFDEQAIPAQQLDQTAAQQKMATQEVERANAAVERTRAGRDEAGAYLEYTRIVSPTDGVVGERKIELGSMAVPGITLIQVEDDSAFQVEVNVEERWVGRIRTGQTVQVFSEALGRTFAGTVQEISPTVDMSSRSFQVKVQLAGGGLRTGLYAKVRFGAGQRSGIFVDKAALVEKGQLTGVYVVNPERKVLYRLVRVGQEAGGKWEILSGLNPGERILTSGLERAVDGGLLREAGTP